MKQCKIAHIDISLPGTLNAFYARFEQNITGVVTPSLKDPGTPIPFVTASEVRSIFLGINPKESNGPGWCLRLSNQILGGPTGGAPHSSLEHLEHKDTYIRLLLINYSSSFNTIIPSGLISKLHNPGLGSALYNWILSFLTIDRNHQTKELIIDFRKKGGEHAPIYINGTEVEIVKSIKFLRVMITDDLCAIENILSGCITAWYGNCSAQDPKKLQKAVCTVQTITEANLPSLDSIYTARCHRKAANLIKDPSHP
eukprot:g35570.t1